MQMEEAFRAAKDCKKKDLVAPNCLLTLMRQEAFRARCGATLFRCSMISDSIRNLDLRPVCNFLEKKVAGHGRGANGNSWRPLFPCVQKPCGAWIQTKIIRRFQ